MSKKSPSPQQQALDPETNFDLAPRGFVRVWAYPGSIARVVKRNKRNAFETVNAISDNPETNRRRMENLIEKENFEETDKSGTADAWSPVDAVFGSTKDIVTGRVDPGTTGTASSGKCARCGRDTTPSNSGYEFQRSAGKTVRVHKETCTDFNSMYSPEGAESRTI